MADAIDAALDAPAQPSDAYLAAVSALLLALAQPNVTLTDEEVEALLDAMPDGELRRGLLEIGLFEAGLLPPKYELAVLR